MIGAVTVAALGFLARPAHASGITVGGAYWDTKDLDEGVGGTAKLTLGRYFELRGSYFSDLTSDTSPERFDFELRAIPVEAGLAWHFAEDAPFSPYVGGGAGYYFLDTTEGEIDDELGWYAVVGGDFGRMSSGVSFNVEAIYRNMEATVRENRDDTLPDSGDIDDKVNLDIGGFGVNAGVTWRF
jgi:hypothetical protein